MVLAFEELGKIGIGTNKGKYTIETVVSLDCNDGAKGNVIYDGKSHVRDDYHIIDFAQVFRESLQLDPHRVTLRFLTPTRIKYEGKPTW